MGLNFSKSERSVQEICTYTRSSMVIPACASTSFSPSSNSLISSSIFSGGFPVFGSRPIRPARYSVFPDRIASLNGASIGPPASLITFLVGCIVTCENAPCTVSIPPTTKTIARKPMRRFILCLHSNHLPDLPRECNTQSLSRQGHPHGRNAESVPQETALMVVCVRKIVQDGLLGRKRFGKRRICWRSGRRNKIAQRAALPRAPNETGYS